MNETAGAESADEDTTARIAITRIFDAPRELVFRAWTEPEQFAHWFGGSDTSVPLASTSMDARPGGKWEALMFAEGREIPWHGVYREVVEPERLVLTLKDRPGDEYELVTVTLTDLGEGRTEMAFEQSGRGAGLGLSLRSTGCP